LTSTVIARRYAKALFAIAREEGKLEAYSEALKGISDFLQKSPVVEAVLVSPVYPAPLKKAVVDEVIKAQGIQDVLATFLRLVVDRRRIQYLKQIVDCFQELMDEETGVVRAVVTTAVPLAADLKRQAGGASVARGSRHNRGYGGTYRRYGLGWQYKEPTSGLKRIHREG
jgi:F-type H+-transporting ATPase subunit delta